MLRTWKRSITANSGKCRAHFACRAGLDERDPWVSYAKQARTPTRGRWARSAGLAAGLLALTPQPCQATDPAEIAWRLHTAPFESSFFGMRVARIGDINNDGTEDYCSSSPFPLHGFIQMFSGATGDLLHEMHRPGMGLYAMAIAAAGDVNGDNHDDVVIASPAQLINNVMLGEVAVVSGQTGQVIWSVMSDEPSDLFGFAVATCSDLDGDDITDVLVGAPGTDYPSIPPNPEEDRNAGAAYVLSGASGAMLRAWHYTQADARAGFSVAAPGDIDDDGVPDLAIGADIASKVLLLSGADGGLIGQLTGQAGSGFGYSMAVAGDADGDGVNDLIVGAPRFLIGGERSGRATIFSGRTREVIRGFIGDDGSELGNAVSGIGDVDLDGYDDVIVAARRYPFGMNRAGRVTVYSGGTGQRLRVISGPFDSTRFGCSVQGMSDITGDSIPDFIVGHERYSSGLGAAYVFSGEPNPPGMMQAATQAPGWITAGRTIAGDIDDDGADDMLSIGSAFDRVTVRMNKGWGEFWGPAHLAVGREPSDAVLVDLDRDNDLDLVVALAGENRIVLYSNSHGILLRSGTIRVGRQPVAVVARDLDGDRRVDIAVANRRDHSISVLHQRVGVRHRMLHDRFRPPQTIALPSEPASLFVARLDQGTRRDLVVVSHSGATVYGLLNNGRHFSQPFATALPGAPAAVTLADLNGDDLDDIAWCDGTSAAVIVHYATGSGAYGGSVTHVLPDVPNSLRCINANSDQVMDLVTANGASANATLLVMPIDAANPPLITTHASIDAPRWLNVGDFDADHDVDAGLLNDDGAITLLFNQIFD